MLAALPFLRSISGQAWRMNEFHAAAKRPDSKVVAFRAVRRMDEVAAQTERTGVPQSERHGPCQ